MAGPLTGWSQRPRLMCCCLLISHQPALSGAEHLLWQQVRLPQLMPRLSRHEQCDDIL